MVRRVPALRSPRIQRIARIISLLLRPLRPLAVVDRVHRDGKVEDRPVQLKDGERQMLHAGRHEDDRALRQAVHLLHTPEHQWLHSPHLPDLRQ